MKNAAGAAAIVRDAGGKIVGRTRLQKVGFLLFAAGLDDSFEYEYRHYGPYSEQLAVASRDASLVGFLEERESPAQWGGSYSTFTSNLQTEPVPAARRSLASLAAAADAVELELAATAVFFAKQGHRDPWREVARRKPEKAEDGRLEKAKSLYRRLLTIQTPVPLPQIV